MADSRVQLGGNRVSVRGTAGNTLSLDAILELPALQELSPDAAGSLSGSLKLSGTKENPVIHVEATGSGVAWTDYVIDTISIDATGSLDQHSVQTDLSSAGRHVTIGAHGAYTDNRWVGIVDELSIEDKLAGQWSTREAVDLTVSRSELDLARTCLFRSADASKACAAATVDLEGATSFDLELIELPLAALPLALPPEVSISGFGNLAGTWLNHRWRPHRHRLIGAARCAHGSACR